MFVAGKKGENKTRLLSLSLYIVFLLEYNNTGRQNMVQIDYLV